MGKSSKESLKRVARKPRECRNAVAGDRIQEESHLRSASREKDTPTPRPNPPNTKRLAPGEEQATRKG
jgi:hypothetical protein